MANKDRSNHEPPEKPGGEGWLFSEQQQKDCRLDGALEGDERDPTKRRPRVATEELFVDHNVREHHAHLPAGMEPRPDYLIPLTGAQLSRMPRYRLLGPMTADMPVTQEDSRAEGALWRSYDAATRTEPLRVVGRDPPTRGRAVNGSTRDEAPHIAAGRVLDAATGVARIVGAHVQVDIALVPA